MLSPNAQRQLQKKLQDRNNWSLMTPEEILGVAKPEDFLSPDQQSGTPDKDLTPVERYLKRQETARQAAGTNSIWGGDDSSRWNPFQKPDALTDERTADSRRAAGAISGSFWKQLFNSTADNNPDTMPNGGGNLAQPFGYVPPPPLTPAQIQAQNAEMERFKEMLMPGATAAEPRGKGFARRKISSLDAAAAGAESAPIPLVQRGRAADHGERQARRTSRP